MLRFLPWLVLLATAQAAPFTLTKTAKGTVLSGNVINWKLGGREIAITGDSTKILTRGTIAASGQFSILLPSPAQMKPFMMLGREKFNVAGCDDQPSDYSNSGDGSALQFWLDGIQVLKPAGKRQSSPFEKGLLYNGWITGSAQSGRSYTTLLLVYSDKEFGASLPPMACQTSNGEASYETEMELVPGWNMVWEGRNDRWGYINARPTDLPHWIYDKF